MEFMGINGFRGIEREKHAGSLLALSLHPPGSPTLPFFPQLASPAAFVHNAHIYAALSSTQQYSYSSFVCYLHSLLNPK